jgi:hypothetical protein
MIAEVSGASLLTSLLREYVLVEDAKDAGRTVQLQGIHFDRLELDLLKAGSLQI